MTEPFAFYYSTHSGSVSHLFLLSQKIYEEYDDLEIGALDHDEIEGYVPEQSAVLTQAINEYEEKEASNKR